jgi:parallel beta-helix repeat protein
MTAAITRVRGNVPPVLANRRRLLTLSLVVATAIAVLGGTAGQAAAKPGSRTLWVSPDGNNTARCTKNDPCKTITAAVDRARPNSRVTVEKGTYREQVTIEKRIKLVGNGKPRIDAEGQENGVKLLGAGAAGSQVKGFKVTGATFEGILALQTKHVQIVGNIVSGNDQGMFAKEPTGECAAQGEVPGDCGEGIHLMSVTGSRVARNEVSNNAGGILLTDEEGPTAHNSIDHNNVRRNPYDCGITLAGHSPMAVSEGVPQPSKAGVHDNRILDNVSNENGTKGEGAGILIAAAAPGSGAYNNMVVGNTAKGNDLAGVTLHSHAPNQDLNGNKIIDNQLTRDGLGGDPDAGVTQTTGILVFSAVSPLTGTVIKGNKIKRVHYGIWTHNVPPLNPKANKFIQVDAPLTQS